MQTIKDIENYFNVSRNTARDMFIRVWKTGSDNVVKFKNTMAIIDFNRFLNELNKVEEDRTKCKRKSRDYIKETKHIGLTSRLTAKEYADQLAAII